MAEKDTSPTLEPSEDSGSSSPEIPNASEPMSSTPVISKDSNEAQDTRFQKDDSSPASPQEDDILHLDALPSEIILNICSFLDARFVIETFSRICKHFHLLVNDDIFWKIRIKKRWPKKYPLIPDPNFNWKEACIEREEQFSKWTNVEENVDHFRFREGISAPVDSVHLMQEGKLLAIGARDRYLNVVDVTRLDASDPENSMKDANVFSKVSAHKGWIWSMASVDEVLATGSWDMHIKFWDINANGQVIRDVKCKSAILSMHYEPDFMVAGGFDKKVYHIDPRVPSVLAEKRYHKKPVLTVAANDKYILTGSEDKTLAFYDRRADTLLKTIELANFPMSMSYYGDQVWVGDKRGLVHLVDASNGDFNVVETYYVGHRGKVTGIQYTLGALYTCSTDRTVRIHEPNAVPDTIATLTDHGAEVAGIHYLNGVLVSGCSDVSVGIWKPKNQSTFT